MNAFELATAMTWAIEEPWLATILEIASREGEGPEAVAAKLGRPLVNTRNVTTRDGVAVVPVVGPIFRRANMLTEVSGATSTEMLARDFRAALDDPAVKAILLDVDSPGGEASGVNELANMIHAARGQKPITAYVSGTAASGAYWLASAADEIVIDDTARLGSIGVVAAYRDTKARDEKAGVRSIEFVSSQSPNKRPDLQSDDGRRLVQSEIDAIAEVFIGAVARNRGVTAEDVVNRFGAGAVKVGAAALDAGLADRAGSFEKTVAELAAFDPLSVRKPRRRMMKKTTTTTTEATEKPVEAIETDAETVAALTESARKAGFEEGQKTGLEAGIASERERLLAIEAIAVPGYEKLIAECKADGSSVADTAIKQSQAVKASSARHLEAIKSDGAVNVPAAATSTGEVTTTVDESSLTLEERCKREWERNPEVRGAYEKFGGFNAYVAGERAAAEGRVSIYSKAN